MRLIRRIVSGLAAGLVLAAAFGARPALANGVVGGGCTEADFDTAFASGGLITFNCGAAPKRIMFTSQKFVLSGDVTIDGGGLITLSGGNSTRLFAVSSYKLTLKNIVLEKGNPASGAGGAVNVGSGALVLDHATIQNSHTNNQPGGAIQVTSGAITLTNNSLIQNNNGYNYGAINTTGTLAMDHSIIRFNSATTGGGGLGVGSLTTINHSQIYSNTATGAAGGGGLYQSATARVTMADSQIYSNTASGTDAPGGGIENFGVLTLTNTSLSANQTTGFGGGLTNASTGQAALDHTVVSGNRASQYSGGLDNTGILTMTNSSLTGNQVPSSAEGGGLGAGGSAKTTLTGSLVAGNTAGSGGGLASAGGPFALTNVTLSGNTATGSGGGFLGSYGVVTLLNVTFSGNRAAVGGAIYYLAPGAGDSLMLKNTLLTSSPAGANCFVSPDSMAPITSAGFNLSDDSSCVAYFNQGGDQNGQPARLLALANNGGPTLSLLPQHDSPAIDNGTGIGCPGADQRGFTRPVAICDIGAVEVQASDRVWPIFLPGLWR